LKVVFSCQAYVFPLSGCVASKNETSNDAMAASSEKQMTGTELKQLLESGITLKLGGEGEGYQGDLVLLPDVTGKDQYVTTKGKKGRIEVTHGERVCERWIVIGENKVEVTFTSEKRADSK